VADEEALALEDLDEAFIEMRKEKVGLCLRVGGDGTDRVVGRGDCSGWRVSRRPFSIQAD
jgi:hypothetical protein